MAAGVFWVEYGPGHGGSWDGVFFCFYDTFVEAVGEEINVVGPVTGSLALKWWLGI